MPLCMICFEMLFNKCMKSSKLERYLSNKHPEDVGKSLNFFEIKKRTFSMAKSKMEKSSTQNKQNSLVSYQLSLLIAKKESACTVGEKLTIPEAKIISNALFDGKCTKKTNEIPLSNTTAKRKIDVMLESLKETVMIVLKQSEYFSLQHDECTDIDGQANLLTFGRFEFNGNIEEEILFCQPLPTKTTGEEIFKCIDNFLKLK
ncbi:Zinc finger BED domain-containing protein 5 [Araneus ventricosus]|uniref:Zinc finger BED domain-containing protein 5 n=1 Tax=Araneus ventricosus TaxID=182803 RepID=A0A4Y2LZ33_ARAVE|nr:Zinc finger BED domain-containing protein 5 [Araneus ventricosus]